MSLDAYRALDLSPSGPVAAALLGRLDEELRLPSIILSPTHAASAQQPAFLTPAMLAWYQAHVASARFLALQGVKAAFAETDLGRGQRGFLLEEQVQEEERAVLLTQVGERRTFLTRDRNQRLVRALADATRVYAGRRSSLGRDARRWRPWRYWVMLMLLGPLEALLNFESFMKIPGFTPAFATALTAIVWLLVAGAGHIVGESWKQAPERFGEHVPAPERRANRRYLLLGLVSILVALGAVTWGRWFYLREAFERLESLGEAIGWGDYVLFVGSLLGNLALFILGVIWSWWEHDEVPGFAEARVEMERLERRLQRGYDRVIAGRAASLTKRRDARIRALEQREADQRGPSGAYERNRASFDLLRSADAAVVALLQHYRNALCRASLDRNHPIRFRYVDIAKGDAVAAEAELDPPAYMAVALSLPYSRPVTAEVV